MTKNMLPLLVLIAAIEFFALPARADNPLNQAQLLKVTQLSLQDYAVNEPEMTKSVSGFKTVTAGNNAKVSIVMDADGMHMTANYLCVPQGADFSCHVQQ